MDAQGVGKVDHVQSGRLQPDCAPVPLLTRNECFLCPLVGLGFAGIVAGQVQVVDEALRAPVNVAAEVGQLVQETEPEVVDAVVAQGEPR